MHAWYRVGAAILLALPLLSCDGEIKGNATFFGKVAVPPQPKAEDLSFETITASGKAPTLNCPKGTVFTETFKGVYAAVNTGGAFASPQFTFPGSFDHTTPPECGEVELSNVQIDAVSSVVVVATLPPSARNCAGFCEAQCGVDESCRSKCTPTCLAARAIVGHAGKPRIELMDPAGDPRVSVELALVFDALRR